MARAREPADTVNRGSGSASFYRTTSVRFLCAALREPLVNSKTNQPTNRRSAALFDLAQRVDLFWLQEHLESLKR